MRSAIRAGALALILASAAVVAGATEDALVAYDRGDFATALKLWRPLAEQGDSYSQVLLGAMYYRGEGVPQDYTEAANWYQKSAQQGNAIAEVYLGNLYFQGQGLPQDAAQAATWYRKAAEQGVALAQNNLGAMYENGLGVPQDYVQAHLWYNLGGASGDEKAIKNRDRVAVTMTPVQIAEAQKLAREWSPVKGDLTHENIPQRAELGDRDAQLNLGMEYQLGVSVARNYVEAYKWLSLAAASDSKLASQYLTEVAAKMTPAQIAEAQKLAREWKPK